MQKESNNKSGLWETEGKEFGLFKLYKLRIKP